MDVYASPSKRTKTFATVVALIILPMLLISPARGHDPPSYTSLLLMLYREGMTAPYSTRAFASVAYFVIGVRYADDYIPIAVSIGECASTSSHSSSPPP
jgi:hypothetical protein